MVRNGRFLARGDRDYLLELARELDRALRLGRDHDVPEGSRWIRLSDTFARAVAAKLRDIAEEMGGAYGFHGLGDFEHVAALRREVT